MEGGGGKNRGIGGMSTYVAAAVAAERTEFKGNPRTGSVGRTNPSPPQSRFGRGEKERGGDGFISPGRRAIFQEKKERGNNKTSLLCTAAQDRNQFHFEEPSSIGRTRIANARKGFC